MERIRRMAFPCPAGCAADKVTLLGKSASFSQVVLKGAGANTWASLPKGGAALGYGGRCEFQVPLAGKGEVTFDQVVQFSPSGEARVSPGIPNVIELGLRPLLGGVAEDARQYRRDPDCRHDRADEAFPTVVRGGMKEESGIVAFSLVEVVVALGICVFCLVALLGLFRWAWKWT